jgi:hypothetical protein
LAAPGHADSLCYHPIWFSNLIHDPATTKQSTSIKHLHIKKREKKNLTVTAKQLRPQELAFLGVT